MKGRVRVMNCPFGRTTDRLSVLVQQHHEFRTRRVLRHGPPSPLHLSPHFISSFPPKLGKSQNGGTSLVGIRSWVDAAGTAGPRQKPCRKGGRGSTRRVARRGEFGSNADVEHPGGRGGLDGEDETVLGRECDQGQAWPSWAPRPALTRGEADGAAIPSGPFSGIYGRPGK